MDFLESLERGEVISCYFYVIFPNIVSPQKFLIFEIPAKWSPPNKPVGIVGGP